jgi:hypothetical protein
MVGAAGNQLNRIDGTSLAPFPQLPEAVDQGDSNMKPRNPKGTGQAPAHLSVKPDKLIPPGCPHRCNNDLRGKNGIVMRTRVDGPWPAWSGG